MHCKTCDYPLWNLKARQCPECGGPFLVSDFDFIINSVQFCCPQCNQAYYGTGEKGHLVPAEFNCVTCGRRLTMNDMVMRPAEGVAESQTKTDHMPWLERRQRGWIKAWFQTVGKSMANPVSLMRGMPPESGVGAAWLFAFITALIIWLCGAGLPLLIFAGFTGLQRGRSSLDALGAAGASVGGGVAAVLVLAAIWGAVAHGILCIGGRPKYSIGRTYQAILMSIGTISPLAVPCVGPYCGTWFIWVWWVVSATLMLMHAQGAHGLRATLAVATFPVTMLILVVGGYAAIIMVAMTGMAGRGSFMAAMPATAEVSMMSSSVLAYSATHNGRGPAHAAELIRTGIGAGNFVSSSTSSNHTQIPIADTTLGQVELLTPNRQAAAIQAAANALPPNVIAHRCGDFVFTYHGINLNACDPKLWIVILSPDPDYAVAPANRPLAVGLADGTSVVLPGAFTTMLRAQNQLRAKYNLPPMPDPSTVTHDSPAVPGGSTSSDGVDPDS